MLKKRIECVVVHSQEKIFIAYQYTKCFERLIWKSRSQFVFPAHLLYRMNNVDQFSRTSLITVTSGGERKRIGGPQVPVPRLT